MKESINIFKERLFFPAIVFVFFLVLSINYCLSSFNDYKKEINDSFESYSNTKALESIAKLSSKKSAIVSLISFFEASEYISKKEFLTFSQRILNSGELIQICWLDSRSKEIFATNIGAKSLCGEIDILESASLIDNKTYSKLIALSEFTRSSSKKQKGKIVIFFPISQILTKDGGKLDNRISEEVFFSNLLNYKLHISKKNKSKEKKKIVNSFLKNLDNIGNSKFIYFSQLYKSNELTKKEIDIIVISILVFISGLFFSLYFSVVTTRKSEVEKVVLERTKELLVINDKHKTLTMRFDLALKASSIGVWDWNVKKNTLLWDDQMYNVYGVRKETFQGTYDSWQNFIHPNDRAGFTDAIDKALKSEKKFDTTFRVIDEEGKNREIKAMADVFFEPDGSALRVVGVNWDITNLKKLQADLEESNQRYELMASGSSVGIWDWFDTEKSQIYWSSRAFEILGYSDKEVDPNLDFVQSILHSEDKQKFLSLIKDYINSEFRMDTRFRLKHKGGKYRWFRLSTEALRKNKKAVRIVGSVQDIHERVLVIDELKKSNEKLDQFAYIASHDLREPLRGMRNFSQFLIEDYGDQIDSQGLEYLEVIKKLGGRLEGYLDSLLYFSRLGREEMSCKLIDISDLLKEVEETYIDPSSNNVEIILNSDLPTILCDPLKLTRIFGNLFQNAVRYNLSEVKKLEIRYEKKSDHIHQFWVKDNGIGIKKDHWDRIFTIFKKLHSRENFPGGTGLGLTLARKACDMHEGDLWVEDSQEGLGTTFTFTITEKEFESIKSI